MNGFLDAFGGKIKMNIGVSTEFGSKKVAITWDSFESLAKHDLRHSTAIKRGGVYEVHAEVQCRDCGFHHFIDIDGAKFRKPVVPGDQLRITCELLSLKRKRFGKVKAEVTVDGQLVCSGELMFSLVD